MKLDNELGFYTYPYGNSNIALRNDSGNLVTRENLKPFLELIGRNNFFYNFANLTEQTILVSKKDEDLVNLYAALIASLELKNIDATSFYIEELRHTYPSINYYSDIYFYEGQLAEMKGDTLKARQCYSSFYKLSEKKFSGFFRGYVYSDSVKNSFLEERKYAQNFLNKRIVSNQIKYKPIPTQKFYYQSFTKGFVLNREDFRESTRILPGFILSYNNESGILTGAYLSWLPNENLCSQLQIIYSNYQTQLNIAFPMQIFKTYNNRLGIKLSPILENRLIQKFEDKSTANRYLLNPGASLSIGYNILPRLSAGAAFTYFYFNEKKYKSILNHKIYNENIASIGIQYLIIKGFAIRADVINGKPMLGLNLSGAFLGYNFYSGAFGLFNRDY